MVFNTIFILHILFQYNFSKEVRVGSGYLCQGSLTTPYEDDLFRSKLLEPCVLANIEVAKSYDEQPERNEGQECSVFKIDNGFDLTKFEYIFMFSNGFCESSKSHMLCNFIFNSSGGEVQIPFFTKIFSDDHLIINKSTIFTKMNYDFELLTLSNVFHDVLNCFFSTSAEFYKIKNNIKGRFFPYKNFIDRQLNYIVERRESVPDFITDNELKQELMEYFSSKNLKKLLLKKEEKNNHNKIFITRKCQGIKNEMIFLFNLEMYNRTVDPQRDLSINMNFKKYLIIRFSTEEQHQSSSLSFFNEGDESVIINSSRIMQKEGLNGACSYFLIKRSLLVSKGVAKIYIDGDLIFVLGDDLFEANSSFSPEFGMNNLSLHPQNYFGASNF